MPAPFALSVALRQMTHNRGQTLLTIGVVATSVTLILFISSLIVGLQIRIVATVTDSIPHVRVLPRERALEVPWDRTETVDATVRVGEVPKLEQRQRKIEGWKPWLERIEALEISGLNAVLASVEGGVVVSRESKRISARLIGAAPEDYNRIVDLQQNLACRQVGPDRGHSGPMKTIPGPLISLEGIGKVYGGEVPTRALQGISFTVNAGEFVAIVGSSGCGKTTLLNLLGLLDRATEGTLRLAGRNVTDLDSREAGQVRRDLLGFIFQFHYLLPEFHALENALMPCRLAGGNRAKEREPAMLALFARLGLGTKIHKRPSRLSGGEQQRVAICAHWRTILCSSSPPNRPATSTAATPPKFHPCCTT